MQHVPRHYAPITIELKDEELNHTSFSQPVVFFYGGPFSNFVGHPITVRYPQPWKGIYDDGGFVGWFGFHTATYETVEHFFQASKAAAGFDHEAIREAESASRSKSLGNSHQSWAPGCAHIPLLRQDWEAIKYEVMLAGLRKKFEHPDYRVPLLATGEATIAEDSPTDFIWGIRDSKGGFTGINLLGKALMQIRAEIHAA